VKGKVMAKSGGHGVLPYKQNSGFGFHIIASCIMLGLLVGWVLGFFIGGDLMGRSYEDEIRKGELVRVPKGKKAVFVPNSKACRNLQWAPSKATQPSTRSTSTTSSVATEGIPAYEAPRKFKAREQVRLLLLLGRGRVLSNGTGDGNADNVWKIGSCRWVMEHERDGKSTLVTYYSPENLLRDMAPFFFAGDPKEPLWQDIGPAKKKFQLYAPKSQPPPPPQ